MKRLKKIVFMLGVAALFGSCVTSVHPIYTQDDLVYDETLLGDWITEDSIILSFDKATINNMPFSKEDTANLKTYYATYHDKRPAEFKVHLVKLDKYYYLDFFMHHFEMDNDLVESTLFPVHTFTKVKIYNDSLVVTGFDARRIMKLLEQRKIRIKHEVSDGYMLLTAPTEELQKFIIKYADDPELFDEPTILKRK
jgi:hypothetical protein